MRRSTLVLPLLLTTLLAACARDPVDEPDLTALASTGPESPAVEPARTSAREPLPDFAALVERYGRAVVNVEVVGSARIAQDPRDKSLLDFFRRFGGEAPEGVAPEGLSPGDRMFMRGAGSGFIVSKDGYILTNAHVVTDADEVTVRLTDRREFPAKVVGTDARTDVAVLKIAAGNLPVVEIGNEDALKAGEWVVAIGSPFGLENSVTAGIVSGTSRAVANGSSVPFIQTDVAVNPGNSGGPLFNLRGEVVGMNSMIFSESGGYMGISFAIPIDLAMEVREQLVKTGRVVRGRIGIGAQDVDAGLARSFDLDRPRGALVSKVEEDSPAQQAGIVPGDVILAVGRRPVERSADLANAVARVKPGSETKLTVWRGGKPRDIDVRVAELEEEPGQRVADTKPRADNAEEGRRLGIVVRAITPREKQSVGTEGNVVVEEVQDNAARAGLQRGDIILAVNSKPVRSVADLRNAAGKLNGGDAAALLVEREGAQIFVPVRVPS